jgi:hypothetical protein
VSLADTLRAIVIALDQYNKDARSTYTKSLAAQLGPLVSEFARATEAGSRARAANVLDTIAPIVNEASAAATKGEIDFVSGEALDRYWQLHTIFREQQYRGQDL